MLKLHGRASKTEIDFNGYKVLTVSTNQKLPQVLRSTHAYLGGASDEYADGFAAYLAFSISDKQRSIKNVFILGDEYSYLSEGDIVRLEPDGKFACLFRPSAKYNTILLTERCNNYCLMCSQPPKKQNDDWLLGQAKELMQVIPKKTEWMGFSGGEPTLYGDGFIDLLVKAKNYLPYTGLDVLTNGRAFSDKVFTDKIANVAHPNCTFGIPLYSDDPVIHDYVVQAEGAFDETIIGICNLKSVNQRVEIRIVIHKQTIDRLIKTCEFIARNLLFVDHVALMGLEITGFTRANLESLWIDPYEYKDKLSAGVNILNTYGISTSVYNHQLCTINDDVLENYQKSISDWKNEYVSECSDCIRRSECGGFFSSSKKYKYSNYITPFK